MTQIKQVSGRIFDKLLTNAGMDAFNGAQGRILYVLWQNDNIPIVELSYKTGLAKTTLTSMLDRMEAANLISRVINPLDRRQIRIILTETAKELSLIHICMSPVPVCRKFSGPRACEACLAQTPQTIEVKDCEI